MPRIDQANFGTIRNGRFRSTISSTEERLQMLLALRFHNSDAAQKVERSLRMREVRGWITRNSNVSAKNGKSKNDLWEAILLDQERH